MAAAAAATGASKRECPRTSTKEGACWPPPLGWSNSRPGGELSALGCVAAIAAAAAAAAGARRAGLSHAIPRPRLPLLRYFNSLPPPARPPASRPPPLPARKHSLLAPFAPPPPPLGSRRRRRRPDARRATKPGFLGACAASASQSGGFELLARNQNGCRAASTQRAPLRFMLCANFAPNSSTAPPPGGVPDAFEPQACRLGREMAPTLNARQSRTSRWRHPSRLRGPAHLWIPPTVGAGLA